MGRKPFRVIADAAAHGAAALNQNDIGAVRVFRRNRFAASTVPEKPAPTIMTVFRILENSTKLPQSDRRRQKVVRGTDSSANI